MKKNQLKPAKISKKTAKRELRKALAGAIPVMLMQQKILTATELELQQARESTDYERGQKESALADFERRQRGYEEKTEIADEARGAIDFIIAELHNHAILRNVNLPNKHNTIGAELIAAAIIARVTEIGDNFSRARDEALAIAEREHHADVMDIEKKLDAALDDASGASACMLDFREQRDQAEVLLRKAESSARNAWRAVDALKRPWWRKA